MKKRNLLLALAAGALVLGVGSTAGTIVNGLGDVTVAKAEDAASPYKELNFENPATTNSQSVNGYTTNWYATISGFRFNISGFNNNQNKWNSIKCGRKGNAQIASISTNAAIDQAISSVVVTFGNVTSNSVNSATLTVASNSSFSSDVQDFEIPLDAGEQLITIDNPVANRYYKLTFNCASGSANGFVEIQKIQFFNKSVEIDVTPEPDVLSSDAASLLALTDLPLNQAYSITGKVSRYYESGSYLANGYFYLEDLTGEILVYGATEDLDALKWNGTTEKYTYKNPYNFADSGVGLNWTVTLKCIPVDYKGTTQLNAVIVEKHAPENIRIEENTVASKTVSEILSVEAVQNPEYAYRVTGTISWDENYEGGSKYGNFNLTDETGTVFVYGATNTSGKLVWSETAGYYLWNNPSDFDRLGLVSGTTVTMKVIRLDGPNGEKEIQGYIESYQLPTKPSTFDAELNAINNHFSLAYKYTRNDEYDESATVSSAYTRVTAESQLKDGNEIVVVQKYGSKYYASSGTVSGSILTATEVTLDDKGNLSDDFVAETTLKATSDGWQFKTSSGYVGGTSAKADVTVNATTFTLGTIQTGQYSFKISGSTRWMVYRADTVNGFKMYAASNFQNTGYATESIVFTRPAQDSSAPQVEFDDVQFRLGVGVDDMKSFASKYNVQSYGIKLTQGKQSFTFTLSDDSKVGKSLDGSDIQFVYVDIGDVLNNPSRLTKKFQIQAWAKIYDDIVYSTLDEGKTVVEMVQNYKDHNIDGVNGLYNILVEKQFIEE